jgi:hypothetical protein
MGKRSGTARQGQPLLDILQRTTDQDKGLYD